MIVNSALLAIAAAFLSTQHLVHALSAADIPSDTPLNLLLSSANKHLAKGETNDALIYYDVAISRDPTNYLTFFKRATAYLSVGRTSQATQDYDKVLEIKPGFEGALLQRAKIKGRGGDWEAARADFRLAGKAGEADLAEFQQAQDSAALAVKAEANGDWEECIAQSGIAIMTASKMLSLRQIRARCRFERGEVEEAIGDLAHVVQLQPGLIEPYLKTSSVLFYALGDMEKGQTSIRKCLHSDPDSKSCKKLYRREKMVEKDFAKINKLFEKRQYATAIKLLTQSEDDAGLMEDIKTDVRELREAGTIPEKAPNNLIMRAVEMTCEAYYETNNHKKAAVFCDEVLSMYEFSLHGLLSKAHRQMEAENFEACIATLNTAKEQHPSASQVGGLLQKAQVALKRSKTKDYYKILDVPNDADERLIKRAYRKMTQLHHPDKAKGKGISKEESEKKMAGINEAYEVLSDPELRARFDRGDDPNSHEQQGSPFQGNPFGGGRPFVFQQGGGSHFQFQHGGSGGRGFPFGN